MTTTIKDNLEGVRARIRAAAIKAGRDPELIRLVCVSKNFGPEQVQEAVDAGASLLGENRVQEALSKMPEVGGDPEWHMIGHLQKNKVRQVIGKFSLIHSVDSISLAEEIERRAANAGVIQDVLIQVNASREASKHGVEPGNLDSLVAGVGKLSHIRLLGLMGIPPLTGDPEDSRPIYKWLVERFGKYRDRGNGMTELSIGMSNDFEVAVEEGATLVRIGTAIFGSRG